MIESAWGNAGRTSFTHEMSRSWRLQGSDLEAASPRDYRVTVSPALWKGWIRVLSCQQVCEESVRKWVFANDASRPTSKTTEGIVGPLELGGKGGIRKEVQEHAITRLLTSFESREIDVYETRPYATAGHLTHCIRERFLWRIGEENRNNRR